MQDQWNHKVFNVQEESFEALALDIFRFQYQNNPIYPAYVQALGVNPTSVDSLEQIPFLPIRFFKSHTVKTTSFEQQTIFESSGTTGSINSRHFIKDLALYEESFSKGFELFYGPANDWCIIGLLPSYLERSNSSLVYMTNSLIKQSQHPQSGFYLNEYDKLFILLNKLEKEGQKTLLIGVSFALLDLAEKFTLQLQNIIVMETGGMKGRRQEMIREELHSYLKGRLGINAIHSEYGMTELLSQAYSKGEGVFNCPPWMKILVRDDEDPLLIKKSGSGAINIIDLANIYSCSFIATDDVGKVNIDGSFQIAGRMDGSDLRGCSLMVAL
jgi:phenylacetate-coenzyme A ligase PaaK-like adenylate-forming protein